MASIKKLDLLLKEIEDEYVQENFRKLQRYFECLLAEGGVQGPQGLPGTPGSPGPEGPQGDPGEDAVGDVIYTSSGTLSAVKLVTVDQTTGELLLADQVSADLSQVLGMSLTATTGSGPVTVRTRGEITDATFSGLPLKTCLFLGSSGNFTTVAPVAPNHNQPIGWISRPNTLFLNIGKNTKLT